MRRNAWKQQLANERGAVLVLVAVSLVMLLGVAAVAIDVGMLYDARNDAQKTADAAALAGASVFVGQGVPEAQEVAEATRRAHEIGGMNRVQGRAVTPGEMQVQVLQDQQMVRVTVRRSGIPVWFARIFGRDTGAVTARAAAAAPLSGTVECLRPIGFGDLWHERPVGSSVRYTGRLPSQPPCAWGNNLCDYYEPNETGRGQWWRNEGMPRLDGKGQYLAPAKPDDVGRLLTFRLNDETIGATDTERMYSNRFYPYRGPCGSGGDCWRKGLAGEVCSGRVSINDNVVTEPGVQTGPTKQGLDDAIGADPNAYWDEATNTLKGSRYPLGCSGAACTGKGSPRIFHVGMIDPASAVSASANGTFPIQNFSAFFLVSYWQGNPGGGMTTDITVRWMKPTALVDNCRQRGNCRENLQLPLRLVE